MGLGNRLPGDLHVGKAGPQAEQGPNAGAICCLLKGRTDENGAAPHLRRTKPSARARAGPGAHVHP